MDYDLKKGDVAVYFLRIDPERHCTGKADGLLNREELAYYNGCSSVRRKNHFLYGRALIKRVISWNSGLPVQAVCLKKDMYGRPSWDKSDGAAGSHTMDINLSHAGEMVACAAILDGNVGIDVESSQRDIYHTALSFFHDKERVYLKAQRKHDRAWAACRLWTVKEAFIKCMGRGFATPWESFNVLEQHDVMYISFRVAHYCISVAFKHGCTNMKERISEVNPDALLDMNGEHPEKAIMKRFRRCFGEL